MSGYIEGSIHFRMDASFWYVYVESSWVRYDKLELIKLLEVSFYSAILHFIDSAITYEPFFTSSILI